MKNLIKTSLITVALTACSTAVIFTACKKENNKFSTNTEKSTIKQSEQDKQTELKIRAFRSQVQSNARITENLSTEEALWYIEAALNYTFCRGSQGILMPEVDTTEITLTETSTGVVAFTEVAEKYTTLATLMETNAAALAQNNRAYMLVDAADMGNNGGVITFRIMMMNGAIPDTTGSNARVATWTSFGTNDNWYYGEKKGRILANGQTQYVGQYDATTVLTNAMNTGQGVINPALPSEPGEFYFTDVVNVILDKYTIQLNYQVPGQPIDNINDYYALYKNKNNCPAGQILDLVLRYAPYDEMNFYYGGIKNHIKPVLDAQFAPENKEMKCCKVTYGNTTTGPIGNRIYQEIWHNLQFDYGVKHTGSIPD